MIRKLMMMMVALACTMSANAQYDFLRPVKNATPKGYDFWVYTPLDYYYTLHSTPVIIFLHGASLCSSNMNRSRKYGPLDAIVKGRQIDALVVVPQNPGGAWNPKKINDVLEWTKHNYACDTTRVYVLGMSLGGYGTLDFCGTYPDKVAAAMALCGGCSLKDRSGLGKLPLWIMHGTADRAVGIKESKVVVKDLVDNGNDKRLRYDWLQGASHGALARFFYLRKTYDWLFSHSLRDKGRPVNRDIDIDNWELKGAYSDMQRGAADPEMITTGTIE